jgi:hypothetical protein
MSGKTEAESPGAKPGPSPGAGAAAFAALGAASRSKADAFLTEQIKLASEQLRLTGLQIENLRDQNAYEVSHLKWRRLNDLMKGVWQILLAAGGVLVVVLIAVVMWNASRAKGLVVDSFSVPPGYAASGMTGEVLAEDITSAVGVIRDIGDARSMVRSAEVRQDRGDDIRLEIPETGVSVGQAWRFLRRWLGHEQRLRGSLRSGPDETVALTVALEGARAFTITGPAADLSKLEQQAAERVFEKIDPNNYILALLNMGRFQDCLAAAERYAQLPLPEREHAAAVSLWGGMTRATGGDVRLSLERARAAAMLDPKQTTPVFEQIMSSSGLGHDEEMLRQANLMQTLRERDQPPLLRGDSFRQMINGTKNQVAFLIGDYASVRWDWCPGCFSEALHKAEMAGRLHDPAKGRSLIAEGLAAGTVSPDDLNPARYYVHAAAQDWTAAIADARAYAAPLPMLRMFGADSSRLALPMLAYALARTGDFAQAEAVAGGLPEDCYECLRARGRVAALKGDWATADVWLARAIAFGPSLPFAYADRGEMLLKKGDVEGAVAQLKLANQKGPNFADALELWGEALTAKGSPEQAVAKFEAAGRLAPNWGRLHLKWGQALAKAGKADLARRQFQEAAKLTLSADDRAELPPAR